MRKGLLGVISDTHGLLRPEAVAALQGAEHIIHAGDIGRAEILDALSEIAPLTVVRGNNDRASWAAQLEDSEILEVSGRRIFVIHDVRDMRVDPERERSAVVVSGHSHKPAITRQGGVLFLNPGSAGPRRFSLPVCIALARVGRNRIDAEIVDLCAARH